MKRYILLLIVLIGMAKGPLYAMGVEELKQCEKHLWTERVFPWLRAQSISNPLRQLKLVSWVVSLLRDVNPYNPELAFIAGQQQARADRLAFEGTKRSAQMLAQRADEL